MCLMSYLFIYFNFLIFNFFFFNNDFIMAQL